MVWNGNRHAAGVGAALHDDMTSPLTYLGRIGFRRFIPRAAGAWWTSDKAPALLETHDVAQRGVWPAFRQLSIRRCGQLAFGAVEQRVTNESLAIVQRYPANTFPEP